MTQEALKLALDLATMHHTDDGYAALREKVRSAIKEALAQPEQEPLEYWNAVEGWVKIDEVREHFDSVGCGTIYKSAGEGRAPLFTTPPQRTWVGLTDEDMYVVSEEESCSFIAGAKWSEEILKEKNAICSPFMISELWRLNK